MGPYFIAVCGIYENPNLEMPVHGKDTFIKAATVEGSRCNTRCSHSRHSITSFTVTVSEAMKYYSWILHALSHPRKSSTVNTSHALACCCVSSEGHVTWSRNTLMAFDWLWWLRASATVHCKVKRSIAAAIPDDEPEKIIKPYKRSTLSPKVFVLKRVTRLKC